MFGISPNSVFCHIWYAFAEKGMYNIQVQSVGNG